MGVRLRTATRGRADGSAKPGKPATRATAAQASVTSEEAKEIDRLARERYRHSASINAAIAMAYETKPALTGAALVAKRRISYSDDLWEELLIRVAEGESVVTVCEDAHMPARTSVYEWMRADPEKDRQYQSAVLLKADKCIEQAKDLARQLHQRAEMGASNEEVAALKVSIQTLQWTAARLNPAKYGDKQQLDIDAKIKLDEPQVDARLAALVAKARAGKDGAD